MKGLRTHLNDKGGRGELATDPRAISVLSSVVETCTDRKKQTAGQIQDGPSRHTAQGLPRKPARHSAGHGACSSDFARDPGNPIEERSLEFGRPMHRSQIRRAGPQGNN